MATALFAIRAVNNEAASPFVPTAKDPSVQGLVDWLRSCYGGSRSPVTLNTVYDQTSATATLASNGLTTGDVAGAAINGVACTATYATSPNNTLTLIKNKINAGGNTPSDRVTLAAYATRYLTSASGYFTLNAATGSLSPQVDGTACTFTATGDNAVDAGRLAVAINGNATAGVKVFAYSDGVNKCYVVGSGCPRATITISSGAGTVGAVIAGIPVTVTWATSDAATATALTAAINAAPVVNGLVRAVNSSSGVVTIISLATGDAMPAIGGRGTGLTVGGTTNPSTTLTISGASGTLTAWVNGIPTSITAVGTNATDAAALAAAINANPNVNGLVVATVSTNVVTVTSLTAISLQAIGTGASASATYLTNPGTYGGVAGNALTLTSATGVTRSGATLSGGVSGVLVTARVPGVAGSWVTFAASGAQAANVTASGAYLGDTPGGLVVAGTETTDTFTF